MKTPQISDYNDYREYLKDFIELNKQTSPKYSFRYFANKLSWPISLISDVINKRKNLSVSRAIEFSKFAKFDEFQTERLIYLSIIESASPKAEIYLSDLLNSKSDTNEITSKTSSKEFQDLELIAVYDYLKMKGQINPLLDIKKDLYTFNISEQRIKQIIEKLIKNSIIELQENNTIKIIKESPFLKDDKGKQTDQTGMIIHSNYAKNVQSFLQNPQRPFSLNSGFICIKQSNYENVLRRTLAFRNWLLKQDTSPAQSDKDQLKLYQFDINIFPISNNQN